MARKNKKTPPPPVTASNTSGDDDVSTNADPASSDSALPSQKPIASTMPTSTHRLGVDEKIAKKAKKANGEVLEKGNLVNVGGGRVVEMAIVGLLPEEEALVKVAMGMMGEGEKEEMRRMLEEVNARFLEVYSSRLKVLELAAKKLSDGIRNDQY